MNVPNVCVKSIKERRKTKRLKPALSVHSKRQRRRCAIASMPCDPSSLLLHPPSHGQLISPTLDLSTVSVLLIDLRRRSREKSTLIFFPPSYLSHTILPRSPPPSRKLSRNVDGQLSGNLWSGWPPRSLDLLCLGSPETTGFVHVDFSIFLISFFFLHECQPSFPPSLHPCDNFHPVSPERAEKRRSEEKKKPKKTTQHNLK